VNRAPDRSRFFAPTIEGDTAWFQHELDEAHKTVRSLMRQIDKEQARYQEIARAYNLTVSNLVTLTHENNALERERDMWRARAQGAMVPFQIGTGALTLTPAEVSAIRKAIARLHHPDTGGDSERLKAWNATLDALED
jgi:formiminotetrahydrofolate cyclodeaminase